MRFLLPAVLLSACLSFAAQDAESTPAQSSRRPHLRLGGIMIGAGYSHTSGGYRYYGSPFGWGYPYGYDAFFFSPYIYPGYFTGYARQPLMGELKLHTGQKEAGCT